MITYIVANYCPVCDIYSKAIGNPDNCDKCGNLTKCECVVKGSEQDPNTKTETVNIAYNENIRVSRSLGVSETQINEARKAHPGTEWVKCGHSYLPVIHNRPEKLKIAKEAGMVEYDPKDFE